MPPPSDWWAGYVANRDNIVPLATFFIQLATFVGAAIVASAALAQARTARRRHQEQTSADRERRITESFAKAGEQIGSNKLEIRLVGIYTLERISRESEREYWPIMETLTAYVRERAPWPPRQNLANPFVQLQVGSDGDETGGENTPAEETEEGAELPATWPATDLDAILTLLGLERRDEQAEPPPTWLATDIQAILTVLGRRDEQARKQDWAAKRHLNLTGTDLRGAILEGAHLEGASLWGAHLEDASLWGAHLEGANLRGAHLEGASLEGAHLEDADLRGTHLERAGLTNAHLQYADLRKAQLQGAHLMGSRFTRAHLEGANLGEVDGLTPGRLDGADGDATTKVADELRPAHWPAADAGVPDNPG